MIKFAIGIGTQGKDAGIEAARKHAESRGANRNAVRGAGVDLKILQLIVCWWK